MHLLFNMSGIHGPPGATGATGYSGDTIININYINPLLQSKTNYVYAL